MTGHAHPHGRPHPHGHHHAAPAGAAAVLDIGGDVGALIVHLDPARAGSELFVRPAGQRHAKTTHTGVWTRRAGGHEVTVAVFAELHAGDYDILDAGGGAVCTVRVAGGEVTELARRGWS
jgi:hypothetical protein